LAICLVVLCVVPVIALIGCVVLIVSCCRSRRARHYTTIISPNQPIMGAPGAYSPLPQNPYPPGAYGAPVNYYYAPGSAPAQPYSGAPGQPYSVAPGQPYPNPSDQPYPVPTGPPNPIAPPESKV
jgi:hypothetical protein